MEAFDNEGQEFDEQTERSPHPALWIVYLFIFPRTFFSHFAVERNHALNSGEGKNILGRSCE